MVLAIDAPNKLMAAYHRPASSCGTEVRSSSLVLGPILDGRGRGQRQMEIIGQCQFSEVMDTLGKRNIIRSM